MKLMVDVSSSKGMVVFFSINSHLFVMLSIARFRGMFVNNAITSNEIRTSEVFNSIFERDFIRSKLLLTWLLSKIKLSIKILCMNFAIGYKAVFTEEIMIRNGMLSLWIFGSPYALGRFKSWRTKRGKIVSICVPYSTIFLLWNLNSFLYF